MRRSGTVRPDTLLRGFDNFYSTKRIFLKASWEWWDIQANPRATERIRCWPKARQWIAILSKQPEAPTNAYSMQMEPRPMLFIALVIRRYFACWELHRKEIGRQLFWPPNIDIMNRLKRYLEFCVGYCQTKRAFVIFRFLMIFGFPRGWVKWSANNLQSSDPMME